jgi:apolipoprotein N-acyltransferase
MSLRPSDRVGGVVLAGLSGLLMATSVSPLECWPVAWVALLPLLLALRRRGPSSAARLGWFAGAVFFAASNGWVFGLLARHTAMSEVTRVAVVGLGALALGGYVALWATVRAWAAGAGTGIVVVSVTAWVVAEWLRGLPPLSLPWLYLGTSQYSVIPVIQVAEVTGVYGVSALIVLVNECVARACVRRRLTPLAAAASVLLVVILGGEWRVRQLDRAPRGGSVRIGVVAGQTLPDVFAAVPASVTLGSYEAATRAAASQRPTVVVWPETAVGEPIDDPGALRNRVRRLARATETALVVGAPAVAVGGDGRPVERNRVHVVAEDGAWVGVHDKVRLMPFAEYVPWPGLGSAVRPIVTMRATTPGSAPTPHVVAGTPLGVLVCYESIVPALARRLVRDGAEVLVNVTNDAWFGATAGRRQHLVHAVFRAVETRRPVVRAANLGYSALIDPAGRIVWASLPEETRWHVSDAAWPMVRSPFVIVGDVFVYLCVGLLAGWCGALAVGEAPRHVPSPAVVGGDRLRRAVRRELRVD